MFRNCLSVFRLTDQDWRLWEMPVFLQKLNLNLLDKSLFVSFLWLDYFLSRNKFVRSEGVTEVWITCDFYGMEQTAKNHWAWADQGNQSDHIRMMYSGFYVTFHLLLLNTLLLTIKKYLFKKRLSYFIKHFMFVCFLIGKLKVNRENHNFCFQKLRIWNIWV